MSLESAISELQRTLESTRSASNWRWLLRQNLSSVREALSDDTFRSWDGWLAARSGSAERERIQLLRRVQSIGAGVLDRLDADVVATEVARLLRDIDHYRQKIRDLVYDSVAMEIGGSE